MAPCHVALRAALVGAAFTFASASSACGSGTTSDPNLCIGTIAGKLAGNELFVAVPSCVAVSLDGVIAFSMGLHVLSITASGALVSLNGGTGSQTTTTGTAVPPSPRGVAFGPDGSLYFADDHSHVVRRVDRAGTTTIFAGKLGMWGSSGDGGLAVKACLNSPYGVAVDKFGNVFIADTGNNAIRVVRASNSVISTIAGSLGTLDASGDGGPAVNATLYYPKGVAVDAQANVYIADTGNRLIRVVRASDGVIFTIAGTPGVPGAYGDGGPAVNATLNYPSGVAVDIFGNIYIADIGNSAIRVIRASDGLISTIAGTLGILGATGDGGAALDATLSSPTSVAVNGHVYIADSSNNAIRIIPMSAPPVCPPGFFCSIGRNLVPCTDSSTYCPANVAAPVPVGAGFAAAGIPSPYSPTTTIYASQTYCPVGAFCPPSKGVTKLCYGGSYGVAFLSLSHADCPLCAPASYLAEAGRIGTPSTSPCLACPAGSTAPASGATFCGLCAPSTYRSTGLAANCSACPHGTSSLYGAPVCFPLHVLDAFSTASGAVAFQRLPSVTSGNAPASAMLATTLRAGLPILALVGLPYALLFLSFFVPLARPIKVLLQSLLERVDRYKMRDPEERGGSPILDPSPLGGALSLVSIGAVLVLMISTTVQYAGSNTQLQQSTLPVTLPALASFRNLPLVAVDPDVAAGLTDAALLALAGSSGARSGFVLTVAAMGTRCGALRGNISALAAGTFVYSSSFDSATGAVLHRFLCANCFVDELSQLTIALDASCQAVLLTLAAASAGGGLSSSSVYVTNPAAPGLPLLASIAATFPLVLEVIQDGVAGAAPRDGDGLVLGGRSGAGFIALPATGVAGTAGVSSSDTGVLSISLALPLQTSYTLYLLSPLLSLLALFSSLAAWLTLVDSGSLLLNLHERAAYVGRRCGLLAAETPKLLRSANGETPFSASLDGTGRGELARASEHSSMIRVVGRGRLVLRERSSGDDSAHGV